MVRAAINGFGRIGRIAFRVATLYHPEEIDIVAVNTSGSMDIDGWTHLFKYDTTYSKFPGNVSSQEMKSADQVTDEAPEIGTLIVNGKNCMVLAQRDPEKLPWTKYAIDVVLECTGVFKDQEGALKHAKAGAKRVVISAPVKGGNVSTYVLGVNDYDGKAVVLSNASCTTNCVAPCAAVMHAAFGIEKAALTTVHGYTDDQNLQDNSHKDLRRARAAAQNVVPTTTGAAEATVETIPELKGIFDGRALRAPVITGSITDFVFLVKKNVTVEEVNQAFKDAEKMPLYKGILATTEEPLVSSDVIGRSESAIVDLNLTQVIGGNLVKVFAWYDNEWGYAKRLVEQAIRVGASLNKTQAPTDEITKSFASSQL